MDITCLPDNPYLLLTPGPSLDDQERQGGDAQGLVHLG